MNESARLLAAYDRELRTDAETPSAVRVERHGPLRLVTFAGGRGFVTYADLGDGEGIGELVAAASAYFRDDPEITRVEWKTRGHDHAPGLHDALTAHGFVAQETESIMIGEARCLAVEVAIPQEVSLRRIAEEHDVRAMSAMQGVAFGEAVPESSVDAALRRLALGDGMELWIAEAGGAVVSAGRLEPVAGSAFAGIWGGATVPQWRGRGVYRALTAARARSALASGKTLINSDSTEFSRPILERSGLLKVSTTTPYLWCR